MPPSHTDPDDVIRLALDRDDAEHDPGPDPSAVELLTETFRGRNRRHALLGVLHNTALLLGAVYATSRFLGTEDVREMLVWGGTTALSVGLLLAVKIWYWLEMVRLALTRDVKRVELRVARLAARIEDRAREP